ncbi:hypothetical protein Droror1_Dr00008251 [Drosera rotundifolia]
MELLLDFWVDGGAAGIHSLVQKLGKRSSVVDENCRQSYDPSNQPLESVDSIFMTFEGEKKQLISVGLQGEHSYARSLAHFAGTLWPVAWKFASKRIEQALPVAGLGNMSHIPQTERLVPLKNLPKRNSSI